ncbi:hypothetical protein OUZ56_012458 [Daphnia magna]|uniref:Uncharacterized protein n=1 Tax=Daphnia magna TaxID=35525 RepID=A0ABQ9Z339_9CRUS|nr:hypothetical protein OUZ56_012458 [Daphnia magna]
MSTPQIISDEDWSLIEDIWKMETSLNDTVELDDTITEDDETVSLPETRSLSTELGHYVSDDALDEYFVNRNALPSITSHLDGTPNWENIFALNHCVGRLAQPGGDSERRWTPFGLPPAAWPPASYSRMSTMDLQLPRATPSPGLFMAPTRPGWTTNINHRELFLIFAARKKNTNQKRKKCTDPAGPPLPRPKRQRQEANKETACTASTSRRSASEPPAATGETAQRLRIDNAAFRESRRQAEEELAYITNAFTDQLVR